MLLAEGKTCEDCFYYKPEKDQRDRWYELFKDKPCNIVCNRTWKNTNVGDQFVPDVIGY